MAGVLCEKNKTKDDYFITNCKEKQKQNKNNFMTNGKEKQQQQKIIIIS